MVKINYLLTVLICQMLTSLCHAQTNACVDSLQVSRFFPSDFTAHVSESANNFLYKPQKDHFDNIYISGNTDLGGPNKYWSILKFSPTNQLLWYKNYKTDFLSVFKNAGMLTDIETNGNLLLSTGVTNTGNPFSFWQIISKADNGGNLLWSKIIKHGTDPNIGGGVGTPVLGDNGELYCTGSFGDDYNKPFIIALDNTGNLLWKKRYQHSVPNFHRMSNLLVSQNSNTLVMAIQYYYNADVITDPDVKYGLQLVKISKADGSIVEQKSFRYNNDIAGNLPNWSYLQKIYYSNSTNQFILYFEDAYRKYILSRFDSELNMINTVYYQSNLNSSYSQLKLSITKDNQIFLINTYQPSPQKLTYASLDNELQINGQREINLSNLGFPNRNFQADLVYKSNGILNFQLATYTNFLQDYLYLFDNSPFYNNISPCLGVDSTIYSPIPIYVNSTINPTIEEADIIPVEVTNQFPDFPPVSFNLPKTEVCKTVSICDSIKLFGTKYHCLSNPLDSFKIYRNPLCKRLTNWQLDTNYIKILSQNDTALYVQYRQPYRGSIKVSFGGCSLTDSIAIEVYNAKTGVNLGNDTMHCPGKTITLKADKGFKTYKWQNNTTLDSLIATQPGNYNVIATDSCGNIFKDSITIAPFDVVLKTDYPGRLCPADTVTFNLPDSLYNYSWLPTGNSSLNNYVWRLYPTATTTYSITGERRPGCVISDTVLINVKPNCLPDYIYFPTGFTPNGDTKNELYKPSINGQLTMYEFTIFNRYGQPIFKTNNTTAGWDGRFKNSKNPLSGTYVWQCKYQFVGRPLQQEQGSFVLIR